MVSGRIFFKQKNSRGALWRVTSKIHRWSSYLLFLPISFWIIGGAFMTWVPIELVRSEHTITPSVATTMSASDLASVLAFAGFSDIKRIEATSVAGEPSLLVYDGDSERKLFSQKTLKLLSPIDETLARQIAEYGYKGDENVVVDGALLITDSPPSEVRGRQLPVWQVKMTDGANLYIDTDTGRIVARRSDVWRAYDFFWMLHTLDFEGRDDFNNKLVMTMSGAALIFLVSGLILTYLRVTKRPNRR